MIPFFFDSAVLYEMSNLLNTGLDRATLSILIELCGAYSCFKSIVLSAKVDDVFTETGVNPEALAAVVKELRREAAALRDAARFAATSHLSLPPTLARSHPPSPSFPLSLPPPSSKGLGLGLLLSLPLLVW
jgi:mitotic-spindle organizing protein 1